ncbi:MAG: hypothetical protein RJB66_1410 [Pseudomonadota bacterium]|jgi:4'-phosphopantetheinyl transferase
MQIETLNIHTFTVDRWETINPSDALSAGDIHLWRINSLPTKEQSSLEACEPLLRFYLGSDFRIQKNPQGKPIALTKEGDVHQVQFNLSHTKDLFVICFVRDHHVGVDVERLQPERSWKPLAKRFYDPAEVIQIETAAESIQQDLFYQFWTLKESMIKCLGLSIFTGLPRARFRIQEQRISLLNPSTEDTQHRFLHFKNTHYFSIAVTPFVAPQID